MGRGGREFNRLIVELKSTQTTQGVCFIDYEAAVPMRVKFGSFQSGCFTMFNLAKLIKSVKIKTTNVNKHCMWINKV